MALTNAPTFTAVNPAFPDLDLPLLVARYELPAERTHGAHHAIRMLMRSGAVPRPVAVLEHSHGVVLQDNSVQIGIGDYRVEFHGAIMFFRHSRVNAS